MTFFGFRPQKGKRFHLQGRRWGPWTGGFDRSEGRAGQGRAARCLKHNQLSIADLMLYIVFPALLWRLSNSQSVTYKVTIKSWTAKNNLCQAFQELRAQLLLNLFSAGITNTRRCRFWISFVQHKCWFHDFVSCVVNLCGGQKYIFEQPFAIFWRKLQYVTDEVFLCFFKHQIC